MKSGELRGAEKIRVLVPSHGTQRVPIVPSPGTGGRSTVPSHGTIRPLFTPLSVPSPGHHLEKPSVVSFESTTKRRWSRSKSAGGGAMVWRPGQKQANPLSRAFLLESFAAKVSDLNLAFGDSTFFPENTKLFFKLVNFHKFALKHSVNLCIHCSQLLA